MIILLGGSSHVGKTLLAQKLMERLHIPYLSLDHLKMAFIRSGRTSLTVDDDVEMRYFLWPFAAEIVKTAIENQQSLIVEGCYIPETWKESFTSEELESIRCVFLVMSERYLREHFADVKAYANVIEQRKEDRPDLERLIGCSAGFLEDCIEYAIPYIEIDQAFDVQALTVQLLQMMGLEGNNGTEQEAK